MSLREAQLRTHIHDLLHDYALTHITTDHIAFTNDAVCEILHQCLHVVPTRDPTSLALEPSLQDLVASTLKLKEVTQYQEKLDVSLESKQYVKSFLQSFTVSQRSGSHSEHYWTEDERDTPMLRPMSPVLTLRALRQTPQIGKTTASSRVPGPPSSLLVEHGFLQVDVSAVETELSKLDQAQQANICEVVLGRKLVIESETLLSVRDLIRQTLPQGRASNAGSDENVHVTAFMQGTGPASPCYEAPRYASPPLFSRDRNPGSALLVSASPSSALQDVKDLGSLLTTAEDTEARTDLYQEHMVVIDGWNAYKIPPSPVSSLSSSSLEEDELVVDKYLPWSSPGAIEKVTGLQLQMMDEHELPRSQRIRGSRGKRVLIEEPKSLQSILAFLKPTPITPTKTSARAGAGVQERGNAGTPKSMPSSPHTSITASLLGQPATALDSDQDGVCSSSHDLSSDDIGVARLLKKLYNSETGKKGKLVVDPGDFILRERLDEKETHLMDVPELLPPNQHPPNDGYMPTTLRSLLVTKHSTTGTHAADANGPAAIVSQDEFGRRGFLEEIKGFKSLNLELSWRPFSFGKSVPTNEEVSRVSGNVQVECLEHIKSTLDNPEEVSDVDKALAKLLGDMAFSDTHPSNSDNGSADAPATRCWFIDEAFLQAHIQENTEEFVLTAAERRRLLGLPDGTTCDDSDEEIDTPDSVSEDRPVKRLRFSSPDEIIPISPRPASEQDDCTAPVDVSAQIDSETNEDYMDYIEDSGIFIPEQSGLRTTTFSQLSDDAQGFEGPADDGEVIPDVDPVLLTRWEPDDATAPAWERPLPLELENDDNVFAEFVDFNGAGYATDDNAASLLEMPECVGAAAGRPRLMSPEREDRGDVRMKDQAIHLPATELPIKTTLHGNRPVPDDTRLQGQLSAKRSLEEFMRMRSRQVGAHSEPDSEPPTPHAAGETVADEIPIAVPQDLVGRHTLTLPHVRSVPRSVHRYLASLDFIQRRGLVRALGAPACAVQLAERESLGDADVIVDADTAIVFSSLRALPSRCDALTARVGRLSWRFAHLLVVFESFPPDAVGADDQRTLDLNPFSPPVIKAVKKFKRDLALAEACYDKREDTVVQFAFPLTLADAAQTVRFFGDLAEGRDATDGALWNDRLWLEQDDEDLDERDLAAIDGMNVFAAAVILTSVTLDDFLERTPEERLEAFGGLIGWQRIETFNTVLARRRQAMELPSSSPPVSSRSASYMEALAA